MKNLNRLGKQIRVENMLCRQMTELAAPGCIIIPNKVLGKYFFVSAYSSNEKPRFGSVSTRICCLFFLCQIIAKCINSLPSLSFSSNFQRSIAGLKRNWKSPSCLMLYLTTHSIKTNRHSQAATTYCIVPSDFIGNNWCSKNSSCKLELLWQNHGKQRRGYSTSAVQLKLNWTVLVSGFLLCVTAELWAPCVSVRVSEWVREREVFIYEQ